MLSTQNIGVNEFESFKLDRVLLKGIIDAGFKQARSIQVEAIPQALAGRDIMGLAQTGTGKTAAFALPILNGIITQRRTGPQALIIAPTRELVQQIDAEFRLLGKHLALRTVTIYGGVSARVQVDRLHSMPHIIIACPGRLLDLMRQGHVKLGKIKTLVLDEADLMCDMGFLPDVKRILSALPASRQNLLFAATMPEEIRELVDSLLVNPHVVELASTAPAETIEHALYPIEEKQKLALLNSVLSRNDFVSAIVFSRTKHRAKRLALELAKKGYRAVALQGNMSQCQRDLAMAGFRQKKFDVLVATDIAARGIDVAKVSHVINFDVPNTPDAYTHRIGRTGRAECLGKAFTFMTAEDRAAIRAIEKRIGSRIPRLSLEGIELPAASERALGGEYNQADKQRRSRSRSKTKHKETSSGRISKITRYSRAR